MIWRYSFSMLIIIIGSLAGWLVSWLLVYLNSLLMSWTGKWLGGRLSRVGIDLHHLIIISGNRNNI